MQDFVQSMRQRQIWYKQAVLRIPEEGISTHLLPADKWYYNLWEGIRDEAKAYFDANGIAWHRHRYSMVSSQALCVNLFFPLRRHHDVLARFLSLRFSELERVVDLDFEYVGPRNYFNEQGGRGQNRTSADVSIRWLDKAGKGRLTLLEFKFTEPTFGECGKKTNPRRERCLDASRIVLSPGTECYRAEVGRSYWSIIQSSQGPFLPEALVTETFCPWRYDFYQLMRNQLLAHCIERDPHASVDSVHFGVCYTDGNEELLQMRPFGGERNPIKAWPKLLKRPETFFSFTVQEFLSVVETGMPEPLSGWRDYLGRRYGL